MYYGDKGTTIKYNPHKEQWQMESVIYPTITATSEASFHTLSLGVYTWTVSNDIECQKGSVKLTISLSSCKKGRLEDDIYYAADGEFTCHDGLCVDLDKRCDGTPDCQVQNIIVKSVCLCMCLFV